MMVKFYPSRVDVIRFMPDDDPEDVLMLRYTDEATGRVKYDWPGEPVPEDNDRPCIEEVANDKVRAILREVRDRFLEWGRENLTMPVQGEDFLDAMGEEEAIAALEAMSGTGVGISHPEEPWEVDASGWISREEYNDYTLFPDMLTRFEWGPEQGWHKDMHEPEDAETAEELDEENARKIELNAKSEEFRKSLAENTEWRCSKPREPRMPDADRLHGETPQMDFTGEQETAIGQFYNDLVDFLESHLHPESPLRPTDVYDYDEDKFIETIADELADECADHGILLNFPEHVTYPDGYERWSDHPYPDDSEDARRFVDKIRGKRDA